MPPIDLTADQRKEILIYEATRWLGIHEIGSNNRGQLVEVFQKASNVAPGDPWCMAFAQYCITFTDGIAAVLGSTWFRKMPTGAHCLTIWDRSDASIKVKEPQRGSIAIWKHKDSSSGHTGIVTDASDRSFATIEGNTGPSEGVKREGDGVYAKRHSLYDGGDMVLVGFILPWG